MCYSLNLNDKQLAKIVVSGLLPHVQEKLVGTNFNSISEVMQRVVALEQQAQSFKKESKYKQSAYVCNSDSEDGENEEVAAVELKWGTKPMAVPKGWSTEDQYDFDTRKLDKLFDLLVMRATSLSRLITSSRLLKICRGNHSASTTASPHTPQTTTAISKQQSRMLLGAAC